MKIKLVKLKCERCGYEWNPRKPEIRMCPSCKTPYWDVPKKTKAA
jgi:Zn finger protein HypA/HybF involved in hydrogenase expression